MHTSAPTSAPSLLCGITELRVGKVGGSAKNSVGGWTSMWKGSKVWGDQKFPFNIHQNAIILEEYRLNLTKIWPAFFLARLSKY